MLNSEFDHIGVVVKVNSEDKENEGGNNRRLVLLEANRAVVTL